MLIPARMASTRLPGKPLADIGGLPMVVRVARQAAQSSATQIVVAADDANIVAACQAHQVESILTRSDHANGSDRLAEACAQLGLDFPPHVEFDPATHAGHVVICPPHSPGLLKRIPAARTAAVTGWALDPRSFHGSHHAASFPLSDHADFPSLLRFVELVQPKRVLTLHGFAKEFAATLRERGIAATPIGEPLQCELSLG